MIGQYSNMILSIRDFLPLQCPPFSKKFGQQENLVYTGHFADFVIDSMNRRIFVQIFGLIALGSLMLCSASGPDWTCYKGSPERMGSGDVPAPDTCYLLWETDLGSELYSSPVARNGKVFQAGLEKLFCIDLNTGTTLWASDVPVHRSTPFLTDEKIIVATNRGISALSIEDGDTLWEYVYSGRFRPEFPLGDYIISSPVVHENRIVVGTNPGYYADTHPFTLPEELFLICLNENSGREEWYLETGLGVCSSPCAEYGRIFAASLEMLCIDLKTGDVLWNSEDQYPRNLQKQVRERYNFEDLTPALYHGILIAGSSVHPWVISQQRFVEWQKIVFMDQYTGNILWEWVEEGVLTSSPALYQGNVYICSIDGTMRCLSFLEGEELWKTSISEPQEREVHGIRIWPSPTATDGKAYVGSLDSMVHCLDASSGEILWSYQTGGEIRSTPAVVPGKVLVSSTDGKLYCFGIDPDTYKMKAEHYIEKKIYDKAEEFLLKAEEYAKISKDIDEIDSLLDFVRSEMPEYEKKLDNLSEAESLMGKADRILWNKKFSKAKKLYTEAHKIYTELDNEFGRRFCEERITSIEKNIPQQSWIETHWWLVIVPIILGIVFVFFVRFIRIQE
jgi:outer membrane protein assembly factor BamB